MRKLIVTTALAVVLSGGAYAAGDHHGGGGPGGGFARPSMGGGGGGPGPSRMSRSGGGPGPSMMSRGPSGPSNFGGPNTTKGSQFSRTTQGPLYNSYGNHEHGYSHNEHGTYGNHEHGMYSHNVQGNHLYNSYNHEHGMNEHGNHGIHVGQANINEFRHGIDHGNFYVHGRHFGFRRYWNGVWVYLTGWDACTAWTWVAVAPGVFAWAPVDVCIG
jgi:hypothetical protein